MRIGYARVSAQDQDTALQIGALEAAGCERVFQEKASGGAGIAQSCTVCSGIYAKVTSSSCGSSTGFPVRSKTCS